MLWKFFERVFTQIVRNKIVMKDMNTTYNHVITYIRMYVSYKMYVICEKYTKFWIFLEASEKYKEILKTYSTIKKKFETDTYSSLNILQHYKFKKLWLNLFKISNLNFFWVHYLKKISVKNYKIEIAFKNLKPFWKILLRSTNKHKYK